MGSGTRPSAGAKKSGAWPTIAESGSVAFRNGSRVASVVCTSAQWEHIAWKAVEAVEVSWNLVRIRARSPRVDASSGWQLIAESDANTAGNRLVELRGIEPLASTVR